MKQCIISTLLTVTMLGTNIAHAEHLNIAAAADLKFALEEIKTAYLATQPNDTVAITFGSSGKLSTQIQQGAPFDVFFSADIQYPQQLEANKHTASNILPYATGRIVLWSNTHDASKITLNDLKKDTYKHIAIADPTHAPYGKRAQEALIKHSLWEPIQSKLVFGENIAQTAQFVQSGNADIGIIALSLALSPELVKQGKYLLIDDKSHAPLMQAMVTTTHGANNATAARFTTYMQQANTRKIMEKYGFTLPDDAPTSPKP